MRDFSYLQRLSIGSLCFHQSAIVFTRSPASMLSHFQERFTKMNKQSWKHWKRYGIKYSGNIQFQFLFFLWEGPHDPKRHFLFTAVSQIRWQVFLELSHAECSHGRQTLWWMEDSCYSGSLPQILIIYWPDQAHILHLIETIKGEKWYKILQSRNRWKW